MSFIPQIFLKEIKLQNLAKALKEADHILAISNNTKNDLIEIYDLDPNKINVTYLGADHFKKIQSKKGQRKFLCFMLDQEMDTKISVTLKLLRY